MLVVTTADNGFKILANADGLRTLRTIDRSYEASRAPTEMKVVIFHPHAKSPCPSFCMMYFCLELSLLRVHGSGI
jgi:hypothetical protein